MVLYFHVILSRKWSTIFTSILLLNFNVICLDSQCQRKKRSRFSFLRSSPHRSIITFIMYSGMEIKWSGSNNIYVLWVTNQFSRSLTFSHFNDEKRPHQPGKKATAQLSIFVVREKGARFPNLCLLIFARCTQQKL